MRVAAYPESGDVMAEKTIYLVTWKEKGKAKAEHFEEYLTAETRAREVSMQQAGAVLIESKVRYIHARWEKGAQTLTRSLTVMAGMEL
jgi:hypothetical protein